MTSSGDVLYNNVNARNTTELYRSKQLQWEIVCLCILPQLKNSDNLLLKVIFFSFLLSIIQLHPRILLGCRPVSKRCLKHYALPLKINVTSIFSKEIRKHARFSQL